MPDANELNGMLELARAMVLDLAIRALQAERRANRVQDADIKTVLDETWMELYEQGAMRDSDVKTVMSSYQYLVEDWQKALVGNGG